MASRARALVPLFAAAVLALGCSSSKPKQAEEPDPLKDTGEDMAPSDTSAAEGAKPDVAAEEAMHTKCCAQCKEALSKDRSGQSADTIPCADYSDLQPWCTEHFRVKPTMAAACQ
jgi:hypothetical protein